MVGSVVSRNDRFLWIKDKFYFASNLLVLKFDKDKKKPILGRGEFFGKARLKTSFQLSESSTSIML